MDKDKIIDYVMNTPGNTNKMVLEGMLGDTDGVKLPEISEEDEGKVLTVIDGKWDKGVASSDKGYECTEEYTLLTDESVTTEQGRLFILGGLAYSTPITADTIRVTFNGVEYICDAVASGETVRYGGISQSGPDFSEYPFAIESDPGLNTNTFFTETAGTYQVKIEAFGESIKTSECFEKAVKKASGAGAIRVIKPTGESESIVDGNGNSCTAYYYDMTYAELCEAMRNGTIVFAQFPIPTGETSNPAGVEQIQIVNVPFNETPSEETELILAYDSPLSALYTNESGKLYAKHCVSA